MSSKGRGARSVVRWKRIHKAQRNDIALRGRQNAWGGGGGARSGARTIYSTVVIFVIGSIRHF